MRLQAVHHVIVSFQKHQMLSSMPIPDENMATVRTTHHKVSTPEIGFFYLKVFKQYKNIQVKFTRIKIVKK
jgi:hypothetical protein